MAKPIKQTYQDYINDGDTGGLSGKVDAISGQPIETVGNLDTIKQTQQKEASISEKEPSVQSMSDVYGPTDYGQSTYDKDMTSATQLNDIEGSRADIQPALDKLAAGIGTFAGKTLTDTAGALGTLVYGIPKAMIDGEFNHIYNNDYNKWIDGMNNSIDNTFKVYTSDAERNGSFFQQTIGSANFWAKSFLGDGMSFVASAVLGANILGVAGSVLGKIGDVVGKGAQLATTGLEDTNLLSKAANVLKYSSDFWNGNEAAAESIGKASTLDNFLAGSKRLVDTTSKMAVGGGYFGSIEANSFLQKAQATHTQQYYEKYGEPQTIADQNAFNRDLAKFNQDILPSANAIFLGNAILAGTAELAVLPHVFGPGVDNIMKSAKKLLTSTTDATGKVIESVAEKSVAKNIFGVAKNIVEPMYEQGVKQMGGMTLIRNLGEDYVNKQYNPDSTKRNYDVINSFGNAMEQAYGTSDGWKSIVSGMLMGALGAPNMDRFGKIDIDPDTHLKTLNPFTLDPAKAWWTGGIYGKFQEDYTNHTQAQKIADDHNKYDPTQVMDHMNDNIKNNQGVAVDMKHNNLITSNADEFDTAADAGDFTTAKTAANDIKYNYYKSRIDSDNTDSIEKEVFQPIQNMSASDFGKKFGYDDNMSEDDLNARKTEVLDRERKNVKDLAKSIKTVDNVFRFDLTSEDGRLNRDMLIYSLHTIDDVSDRSDQLRDTIRKNTEGKIQEFTPEDYNTAIDSHKSVLKELKDKKVLDESSGNKLSNEQLADYNKKVDYHEGMIDNYNALSTRDQKIAEVSKQARVGGLTVGDNLNDIQHTIDNFNEIYKDPKQGLDADLQKKNTLDALTDLKRLRIRQEEALELYATAKDPANFNNFYNRRYREMQSMMKEGLQKTIDSQNDETKTAATAIDNSTSPFDSGASMQEIAKLQAKKKFITQLNTKKGVDGLIQELNSTLDASNQIPDQEGLEAVIKSLKDSGEQDGDANHLYLAKELQAKLNKVIDNAKTSSKLIPEAPIVVPPINEPPVGDLSDNVAGFHDTDQIDEIITGINQFTKGVDDQEMKLEPTRYLGDKLRDAYRHIGYLARNFTNILKGGSYIKVDGELNEKASKLILDYTKINAGSSISFEIQHDLDIPMAGSTWLKYKTDNKLKKDTKTYNDLVPIAIKSDGNIIGYLHGMQFMNADHIAEQEDNITNNKNEISKLRNYLVNNPDTLTTINYRSNGKLIKIDSMDNSKTKTTNEAFKDKSLVVTTLNAGKVILPDKFGGRVINEITKKMKEGIVALLPVNHDAKTKQVKYIAVPLSPSKLRPEHVQSIVDVLNLHMRKITGELTPEENVKLNNISNKLSSTLKGLGTEAKQRSFDVKTLTGLRNYISLFTYARKTVHSDMGLKPGDKSRTMAFAIDSLGDSFVVSFGSPGSVTSYNITTITDPNGTKRSIVGKKGSNMSKYSFTTQDANATGGVKSSLGMNDFADFKDELTEHLSQSYFYSNKELLGKKIKIPIVNADAKEGEPTIKFSDEMDYSDHLKNNTETNLTSFDIGTPEKPNHIYTVQSNVAFDTSKITGEIDAKENEGKTPVQPTPSQSDLDARAARLKEIEDAKKTVKKQPKGVEDDIADIERIRQEELDELESLDIKDKAEFKNKIYSPYNYKEDEEFNPKGLNLGEVEQIIKDGINAKYDAELQSLVGNKQETSEFTKPEGFEPGDQSLGSLLNETTEMKQEVIPDKIIPETVQKILLFEKPVIDVNADDNEDFDIAVTAESSYNNNSSVDVSTEPTIDLESEYTDFFKNDLDRDQQKPLRQIIKDGGVQIKCE